VPILVLSDIHANLEALEAVMSDAGDVDAVLCLGDLIGYGPNPNEVSERVLSLAPVACLSGNHDLAALGRTSLKVFNRDAATAAQWSGDHLAPDTREWLLTLQSAQAVDGAYLAHASPRDPVWEYMEHPGQGPPNFDAFEGSLCFVGHTHVPRAFEQSPGKLFTPAHGLKAGERLSLGGDVRMIVNPGGVGQPRDGDWRASYGLWDRGHLTFELRRVEYPVEQTQQKILDAGLPESLAYRLSLGR
jgi:predicted phosphodiesterase